MFRPETPQDPAQPVFDEPWQAQALALADALIQAGQVSATVWGDTLGAALRQAEAHGAPDTPQTYFLSVVEALEAVCEAGPAISPDARAARKADWIRAYETTPHGAPVDLKASD